MEDITVRAGSGGIRGRYVVVGEGTEIASSASIWNLVYIGSNVRIGERVRVGSLVHIGADVTVGDGTLIEGSAYISDLCRIGRNCFIGPNVTITNDAFPPVRRATGTRAWAGVVIEDEVIIGGGANLRAGVRIGKGAVVGMGAVVISDVASGTVVAGNPAKVLYGRGEYDRKQKEAAGKG